MCWSPTLHCFPKPVSPPFSSSRFAADVIIESFRIAFDDLIDSMEDEAADQRSEHNNAHGPSRQSHLAYQAVAGTSSQQTIDQAVSFARGMAHCSASSTWQQKVIEVEAKLQNDLQQDLARSVLGIALVGKADPPSAWHQCLALALRSTPPQTFVLMLRHLLPSIALVTMTFSIFQPTPAWLSHDRVMTALLACLHHTPVRYRSIS